MAYFLTSNVQYTEQFEPEHTYTFYGKCVYSGKEVSVTVKGSDLFKYHQGKYIQNAFPYLTPNEREWMITGMYELGF